ncbi:DMT family transporter [uncultured Shewanella sp.]|uniref:DMT family transporter n=1 Tax=uncultured Shewanella sp. TaxID=173975 RepID=UPI00261858C9|nr:DMT family transporter [uncultured Shewanella sp.]
MTTQRISNHDFLISVVLMLFAAFSLSIVALLGKELTTLIDFPVLIFLRFFIPFLILLWIAIILIGDKWDLSQWRLLLFRALLTVSSQYCLFYYLLHGSLLNATLLFTTSGLFLPFISFLCFRAEIKIKTLVATIISFIGVSLILQASGEMDGLMLIGLLSGFLNACSQVTMHYSSKRGSAFDVTLMMFAFSSFYTFILVLVFGHFTSLSHILVVSQFESQWLILLGLAVFTISNQSLRTKAYSYVNKPASLTPFYYIAIVFSALLDWFYYGRTLQLHTYAGFLLIFMAAVALSWRGKNPELKS